MSTLKWPAFVTSLCYEYDVNVNSIENVHQYFYPSMRASCILHSIGLCDTWGKIVLDQCATGQQKLEF